MSPRSVGGSSAVSNSIRSSSVASSTTTTNKYRTRTAWNGFRSSTTTSRTYSSKDALRRQYQSSATTRNKYRYNSVLGDLGRNHHQRRRRLPVMPLMCGALLVLVFVYTYLHKTVMKEAAHQDERALFQQPIPAARGVLNQDPLYPKSVVAAVGNVVLPEEQASATKEEQSNQGNEKREDGASATAQLLLLGGATSKEQPQQQQPEEWKFCNMTKTPGILSSIQHWKSTVSKEDATFQPYTSSGSSSLDGTFLSFELPTSTVGLQAPRMVLETMIVLAASLGRTLVLPPKQGNGQTLLGYEDSYDLKALQDTYQAIKIISMQEFLEYVANPGYLRVNNGEQMIFPPNNKQTNWDNTATIGELWQYLRQVGTDAQTIGTWNSKDCILAPEYTFKKDELDQALEDIWKRHSDGRSSPTTPLEFQGKPTPVNAPWKERLREFVAASSRKRFCEIMPSEEVVLMHIPTNQEGNSLLQNHFYATIFHTNWKQDVWTKRLIRDRLHYQRDIYCMAAQIMEEMMTTMMNKNEVQGAGYYHAIHIRSHYFEDVHHDVTEDANWIGHALQKWMEPKNNIPIYIATDEGDPSFFAPLRELYPHLYFASDFGHIFSTQLGHHPERMELVEQVLCANANIFVGTYYSTFSGYVHRLRGYYEEKKMKQKTASTTTSSNGSLKDSYYHSPTSVQMEMSLYRSIRAPYTMREFPIAWRDIDHGSDMKSWELELDTLKTAAENAQNV